MKTKSNRKAQWEEFRRLAFLALAVRGTAAAAAASEEAWKAFQPFSN